MRRNKTNLFFKTQRKLTINFSLLIILFLLLFITILYSIVYVWFTAAEKNELRNMAEHEEKRVESLLEKDFGDVPNGRKEDPEFVGDQLFYYVINMRRELILQDEDEQLPFLQNDFINFINDWQPAREELRNETINLDRRQMMEDIDSNRYSTYVPENQKLKLLMIAKPIYERSQIIGYLYIGKNITDLSELLNGLFKILVISALIFSGIAYSFSRIMSRRAMVPIEQAFRRQQEFVADASHELRTPLSVMLSSLDILEMENQDQNEMAGKMVDNLKDEVKRMTGLVGDLLTLARSDSDDQKITFEEFNLYSVAERTIASFEAHALAKRINLELNSPEMVMINGNKERLTQLLYILLDNAIKYSQDAGSVTLSIWKEANMMLISVRDTGIGMDPKELPHIFERFYRVDKARTRQQGGHGLGLSIAKWIVELHNGRISVESKLGEGSTFLVKIPEQKRKRLE
ncbi:cell wall metabolism sensor histidine kinase WalK [Bacillus sp. SA1-12]|uniref:sensor histidine kinase n=1 Tax=Bacillus sp. SA1-12 TaxID=1455638 RepID=UPI0006972F97|nr:ATP-binding protein [Bacillus sp. SA1-12]